MPDFALKESVKVFMIAGDRDIPDLGTPSTSWWSAIFAPMRLPKHAPGRPP
jgi:hypothetical protein